MRVMSFDETVVRVRQFQQSLQECNPLCDRFSDSLEYGSEREPVVLSAYAEIGTFKQTVRLSIERGARERWMVNNKYIEEGVIEENDFLTYFFWFQKPILQAVRILETICRDNGLTTAYERPFIIVSRNNVGLFHLEAFTDLSTLERLITRYINKPM